MKSVSQNVNGLQACLGEGFLDFFRETDADIFCPQETKTQESQAGLNLPGYLQYQNPVEKKGYSGMAVFTKKEPLSACYDIRHPGHTDRGHAITLEFESSYLVNVYTPNSQRELVRLPYRMEQGNAFRRCVIQLDKKEPVIICGDLNVAHQEIDLKNAESNIGNAGFSYEECGRPTEFLASGFLDSFYGLYPDLTGTCMWWSYMFKAHQNNTGRCIDYLLTSERLREELSGSPIYSKIQGSDHCPVGLALTYN